MTPITLSSSSSERLSRTCLVLLLSVCDGQRSQNGKAGVGMSHCDRQLWLCGCLHSWGCSQIPWGCCRDVLPHRDTPEYGRCGWEQGWGCAGGTVFGASWEQKEMTSVMFQKHRLHGVTLVPQLCFAASSPELSLRCLGAAAKTSLGWSGDPRTQDWDIIEEFNLDFNETTSSEPNYPNFPSADVWCILKVTLIKQGPE